MDDAPDMAFHDHGLAIAQPIKAVHPDFFPLIAILQVAVVLPDDLLL